MMRGITSDSIEQHADAAHMLIEAADGKEALDVLYSQDVDLILLDWQMPHMDGLQFVQEIRGQGITTPVVMITAVTDPLKIIEAGEAGVNAYIEKPITHFNLWKAIKKYF